MTLHYVFAVIGCIPGIVTMSPCQHGARLKRQTPGYYTSNLTTQEDSSVLGCAALCLVDPSCAAISVTSLNSSQSKARAGRGVYCRLSDSTGEFVPDSHWVMYTLLSYSPTDGTCDSRLISETTLPATTTTEVSTTPRTCPPDFVTLNGGCYKYHQEKKTWMEAKTTCESESDHLVALTSLQEQNQIAIAIYGIRGAGVTFHGGGNDMDSDGIWEWPDGQPFDFSYWEGAVPTGGCLVVPVYPGKWTTGNCASDMREFMCEIDM